MIRRKPSARRRLERLALAIILVTPLAAMIWSLMRAPTEAGGPLLINDDGTPFRWSTQSPIVLNPDLGNLGEISDPVSVVADAIAEWNAVSTSAVRMEIGESLNTDLENLGELRFTNIITRNDGRNPVIFDSDGSTIDAIFGPGSGVLGVAGPTLVIPSSGDIVKGYALFNGEDRVLLAAVTHELGHFLNLDHAQINGVHIDDTVPGFADEATEANVTTMHPVLVSSDLTPHPMATLHTDDEASLSALYPGPGFGNLGRLDGFVFDLDGSTPLQGVNVVARNIASPLNDAVSGVSGQMAPQDNGLQPAELRGFYELPGLTPGETYIVYIEEIDASFDAGSGVGPIDPPVDLDPSSRQAFLEFWDGATESSTDDPRDSEEVTVGSGTSVRADFVFNGTVPRVATVTPTTGSYTESHLLTIFGENFEPVSSIQLVGPDKVELTIESTDPTRAEATVPISATPGTYRVVVSNDKGPSEEIVNFSITELPPTVDSVSPSSVVNNRLEIVSITGENLLGVVDVRLSAPNLPTVSMETLRVDLAENSLTEATITAAVPLGTFPTSYDLVVVNTAGTSASSSLNVFELAPQLNGATDPEQVKRSRDTDVRVFGDNLAGTLEVVLQGPEGEFPVDIVSTSLSEVVVTVPRGLPTGAYTVSLTNTAGGSIGTAEITVKSGGGGGGGCGALPPGGVNSSSGGSSTDFILMLLGLVLLRLLTLVRRPATLYGHTHSRRVQE